ncbi:MAG: NUDIX hydrolase [Alphaproteobacteria bacterium]|nr:MAG: NUDIX hydrolase [Alphaproteobacteria bacterium]
MHGDLIPTDPATLAAIEKAAGDLPVSAKAVMVCRGHILLLRQRKNGWWELPGGRHDEGDATVLDCLVREVTEETGLAPTVIGVLDHWVRVKANGRKRFVIDFLVTADVAPDPENIRLSREHDRALFLAPGVEPPEPLLEGYRRAIDKVARLLDRRLTA